MTRFNRLLLAVLFAPAGVALASLTPPASADETAPLPVAVEIVRHADRAEVTESFAGVASARRSSRLGFEQGGRLAEVNVDVGAEVKEGDTLASLDLRSLDAQIAAAEAGVKEADAGLTLANVTQNRQRDLADKGHISDQRLDEAVANVAASRARRDAARAQLETLKVRRDLSILTAPYDGVVVERHLDEGTIAAPGIPVIDLVEAGAVEIRVGLPLEQARRLVPGDTYTFKVAGRAARAKLRAETGVVDRNTQTVAAVFDLAESGGVAPGEVARLELAGEVAADGFWAPITALSEGRRGLWTLLALEPENGSKDVFILKPRIVDVLYTETERAFVRGSLADGELVVAAGIDRVASGMRVTPADSRPAPDGALASNTGR